MKKFLLYATLAVAIFASCRKTEDKMIIGTWRASAITYDTNRNRILEANEKYIPKANENVIYTFKRSGDLHYTDGTYTGDFQWDLNDDGKILTLTLDGQPTTAKVLLLNNSDLKLEYEIPGINVLTQLELKKQ